MAGCPGRRWERVLPTGKARAKTVVKEEGGGSPGDRVRRFRKSLAHTVPCLRPGQGVILHEHMA